MKYPTVHINGTSKAELLSQLLDVRKALQEAIKLMRIATPHGRDYYVQKEEEETPGKQARVEHWARMELIESVEKEVYDIAINISRQGK